MKTFTLQSAIEELQSIFGEFLITDVVDTPETLEVYFSIAGGEQLLLLSNDWEYFQDANHPYLLVNAI